MKRLLFIGILTLFVNVLQAQVSYTIYDGVIFYDGYATTVDEPTQDGVVRINNARYTTKLSDEMVNNLSEGSLSMDIIIGALCDNYDRLGEVFLAFVPQGATEYNSDDVQRIEIGRIITPFMNKNINPTEVPYHFKLDNISELFADSNLNSQYDFWLEFEVFGVPYAAQTQVPGCAGRIDVFTGTLVFNVDEGTESYTDENFILPLSDYEILNNYDSTDVPDQTTKIINFTLDEPVENAVLYLISSNHGANAGGEEYIRRWHYVYLDDELVYEYMPGGKSCEPYRQYNTQGNGIYSPTVQHLREWLSFNNWCPGDKIPNREVILGNLVAGNHTIKLDVPDAVFNGDQGYFPISMYIQNRKSGQLICAEPTHLEVTEQIGNTLTLDWDENGNASQWEVLYGRTNYYDQENYVQDQDGEPGLQLTDLTYFYFYDVYVRSLCDDEFSSVWTGPVRSPRIMSTDENELSAVKIYPNPVQDILKIESEKEVSNMQIFSIEGKKLIETTDSNLNVSRFPAGNYIVFVKLADGEIITKKVVKQ